MSGTDGAAVVARAARVELERLLEGEPAIRAGLPAGYLDDLQRYVELLLAANRRLNLTRLVDPEPIARLHLLDALAALPLMDEAAPRRAIDLGSGGGVPAVPLAMARRDVEWVMVDSVRKKATALEEMILHLRLRRVAVLAERAEALGRDAEHRERYGLVTARACAALPVLAELALPLAALGGRLIAWKGPLAEGDDELRRGRAAIGQVGGGRPSVRPSLPELGGHTFVVVPKVRPAPARFPRRAGEPGRRPLG